MINQVSNSSDKNVFAPLKNNDALYAISKPFTETQKREMAQEENDKEKQKKHTGLKVAAIAISTGFGLLFLSKGLSKNTRLKLRDVIKRIEDKTSSLKKNRNRSKVQDLYYKFLKGVKKTDQYIHGYFNFAPLKDAPAKFIADKHPLTKKIWDGISRTFEKISIKTSKKSYSKTQKHFERFYEELDSINSGLDKGKAGKLRDKIKLIKAHYNDAFENEARSQRLTEAKQDMGDIHMRFYNRTYGHFGQMLKDKRTYTTFISEEEAAKAKIILNNKVSGLKNKITFRTNDNYMSVKRLLNTVDLALDPTNSESRKVIKNLRESLEAYKKTSNETVKKDLINRLEELGKHVAENGKLDKSISEDIAEKIKIVSTSTDGEIQQLMIEYKSILAPKEYAKLEKRLNKALNSLDKSTDLETDKLFDKIRDIQIGSAPMDIVGVLGSLVVVGWWLGKAENKDERISAALKYGIPAIGAVAISLYCTIGLVSGGPALLIGLVAGKGINLLGNVIDKKRKEYKQSSSKMADASQVLPKIKKAVEWN